MRRVADDQRHGRVIAEPSPHPGPADAPGHLNLPANSVLRLADLGEAGVHDWPARVVNPRCLDPLSDVIAFTADAYD